MAPSAPVLLVFPPWAPNVEHPESGPAYLKAALQQRGHQAVVLDLNVQFLAAHPEARRHRPEFRHAEGPLQPHPLQPPTLQLDHVAAYVDEQRGPWQEVSLPALLQQLPPGRPIVGFSIFSPTQLPVALQLARGAREARPGARIVLGGPWCAAAIDRLPRVLQRYPFVDGAVPYDGETPLCNLAEGDPDASLDELPGFVTARASLAAGVPSSVPMTEQSAPDYADLPLGLYPHATLS
jgi:hypothetical protein